MGQTPGGETRSALEREFPGVGILERGERVSAVFGRPMTRGATAREAMEDWMDPYLAGDLFCDFTGDGVLDFFDFLAFQQEFAAGCWE